MSTAFKFPTMPSSNAYAAYRFGIAMADHTIVYPEGPAANSTVIVAYTAEEEDIIAAGTRQTGHQGQLLTDRGSSEPDSTNTLSPVAHVKKNRYGV